jgi:hypothetical protein
MFLMVKPLREFEMSLGNVSQNRGSFLKVLSGQIGSTLEWCHWKGLEKDINCYRFLIF